MHTNYYFLRQLAPALTAQLRGYRVASCFSQEKDELVVGLTDGASVESRSPALHTLMSDAQAYHWTFAAVMLVLGVVGCVVAGACLRRRRGSAAGSRVRVMSTTVLVIACVAAALYLGLAVYTVTLALHPADALVNVLGTE